MTKLPDSLLESKEEQNNKKALKAAIWYIISNIVIKSIGILTTPIFARMMSKAEFGEVATFTSWHAMLSVFFSLNLAYSVGRAKLDFPNHLDNYIGSSLLLSGLTSILLITAVCLFPNYSLTFLGMNKSLSYLLLILLFAEPAVEFYTTGCRFRYLYKQNIAITLFIAIFCPIISISLMYLYPQEIVFYRIIGTIIPKVLISAYIWLQAFYKKNLCVDINYWKYGIAISFPLIFHILSIHLLSQSDRIFISKICGDQYVGLYSLVYSYGILLTAVSRTINQGWLPWFHDTFHANNFKAINNKVKPLVILACYIALACIAFAPEAVKLLGGNKYAEGAYCVMPIVIGVLCQFIYGHYVNIELHLKKTKYVAYGTITAALLNLLLNSIFIPKYGYIAAAYTTLASYFALMIIHFTFTKIILKVNLYNNRFMFFSIAITSIIAIIIQYTFNNNFLRYSFVCIGFISFILAFKDYFGLLSHFITKKFNVKH